jgi:hypothetical protein
MENFQAVMRLSDSRSTKSDYKNRYACLGPGITEFLENTTTSAGRTTLGNIWVFDINSTDPEIRDRSLEDCAWFKRVTSGQDLTQFLAPGTPVLLSNVETPVHLFLGTGYKASLYEGTDGRLRVSQHPDLVAEDRDRAQIYRDERKEMSLAGLDKTAQVQIIGASFQQRLLEKMRAMEKTNTPKVNLSEIDFSKINFGAVPVVTPPQDKTEDQPAPDFSNPADESDTKAPF